MGKQSRAKKSDPIGKGKVTPVQVAFIVDRYLFDNNFTQTRSVFRNEASSLIAKSPVHEAPSGLLSLGAMLNEYISLKEQKVMVDQERIRLEQESWRIQTLLRGMQEAMNSYNSGGPGPTTPAIQGPIEKSNHSSTRSPPVCPAGNATPVMPFSVPHSQTILVHESSSSQVTVQPSSSKRKAVNTAPEESSGGKKSRSILSSSMMLPIRSSLVGVQSTKVRNNQQAANPTASKPPPQNNTVNGSIVQGSCIAKRLFYPPLHSTPTKSSVPTTPPQGTSSRSDKSASSMDTSSATECSNSNANTPEGIIHNHCTVVSYEKITVSPFKKIIERGQCISSSSPVKRVKGRLDFNDSVPEVPKSLENEVADNTSTSESEKEIDIFDLDFPNLDMFGPNFSFSELLVDLDLDGEDINHSSGPTMDASGGTMAGLLHESRDDNLGADQLISEYAATVTEIHSEKDIKIQGENNLMAVKSVTRCTSVSPVKNLGTSMHQ